MDAHRNIIIINCLFQTLSSPPPHPVQYSEKYWVGDSDYHPPANCRHTFDHIKQKGATFIVHTHKSLPVSILQIFMLGIFLFKKKTLLILIYNFEVICMFLILWCLPTTPTEGQQGRRETLPGPEIQDLGES